MAPVIPPRIDRSSGVDAHAPEGTSPALSSRPTTDGGAPRWYTHRLNRAAVYHVAAATARLLPRAFRLGFAGFVADRLQRKFPVERAVVRANLARIAADLTDEAREALVGAVFRNFAICFADLLTTNRRGPGDLARLLAAIEGAEHLDTALAGTRGVVVLTAHLGNWELAGRLLPLRHARPIHVVVAAEVDPGVERFLRGGPVPVRFVARTHPTAVLSLVAALRRGEVVAMQGDRALGDRSDVGVRFFGAEAPFPLGPFVLARATGARVVPAFCVLTRNRRYTIQVGPPMHVGVGGERAALTEWVHILESAVRCHPEQWFNFFDVWSPAPAR